MKIAIKYFLFILIIIIILVSSSNACIAKPEVIIKETQQDIADSAATRSQTFKEKELISLMSNY
ncbi:MAG: hypothetical protein FJW56_09755 [Actinobacteria bacterium]|nr:hypothetical protein [Actinomycetota bacterium]